MSPATVRPESQVHRFARLCICAMTFLLTPPFASEISAFGVDNAGYVYLVDLGGSIYKLTDS